MLELMQTKILPQFSGLLGSYTMINESPRFFNYNLLQLSGLVIYFPSPNIPVLLLDSRQCCHF